VSGSSSGKAQRTIISIQSAGLPLGVFLARAPLPATGPRPYGPPTESIASPAQWGRRWGGGSFIIGPGFKPPSHRQPMHSARFCIIWDRIRRILFMTHFRITPLLPHGPPRAPPRVDRHRSLTAAPLTLPPCPRPGPLPSPPHRPASRPVPGPTYPSLSFSLTGVTSLLEKSSCKESYEIISFFPFYSYFFPAASRRN